MEYIDIPAFNYNLGWAYFHLAVYENGKKYLYKAITGEVEPHGYATAFLSNAYFQMGNINMSDFYRDILLKNQSLGRANMNIPLAMISSARGNENDALFYLEKAYSEKDFGFAWYLNIDPVFNPLKNNGRFIKLIASKSFV